MTVSTMDTAQLPHTGTDEAVAPAETPSGDRSAICRERRQLRRQQRLYAAAGIAVLAAVFLVAVIVLGGIR